MRPVVIVIHHVEPYHSKTATTQRLRSHLWRRLASDRRRKARARWDPPWITTCRPRIILGYELRITEAVNA